MTGHQYSSSSNNAFVFGSLGPLVESYRPDLILKHDEGVSVYTQMIAALAPSIDAFLAETLSSVEESMQVVEALAQPHVNKPLLISYTLNSQGKLRSGEAVDVALPRILDFCKKKNVSRKSFIH
jgi:S-methylmethionine-dependent homocysteine/selenocysteine methylase